MTDLPYFPFATKLNINTSNVLKWGSVPVNTNPTDYALNCFTSLIKCWKHSCCSNLLTAQEVTIQCPLHNECIPNENRPHVRITVKLFLFNTDVEHLEKAIESTLKKLGIDDLEMVIISFAPHVIKNALQYTSDPVIECLLRVWPKLEELENNKKIITLGVCDLTLSQLKTLKEKVRVQPLANQLFVTEKSVDQISEELRTYASENLIQLLTHQDSPDILPLDKLSRLLSTEISESDGKNWNPLWFSRYTTFLQKQAIISSKGFLLSLERPKLQS